MLHAVLNKSCKQQPTKDQLNGHLLPILQTTQLRQIRYAEHQWMSKDELISDILRWTPTYESLS